MTDEYVIQTDRLILRPVQESDAGPTASLITPAISQWTATWPTSVSIEEATSRINSEIEARNAGSAIVFAIVRRSDNVLLGWTGFHRKEPDGKSASFGYWLGENFHGNGYMTEAAAALIDRIWSFFDVDLIEAGAQPENGASIAILKKLGMHYIGDRSEFAPVRNRNETCVYYEISRPKK